jgi:hypothetical protein
MSTQKFMAYYTRKSAILFLSILLVSPGPSVQDKPSTPVFQSYERIRRFPAISAEEVFTGLKPFWNLNLSEDRQMKQRMAGGTF